MTKPRVFLADESQGGLQWIEGPAPATTVAGGAAHAGAAARPLSDPSSRELTGREAIAIVPAARMRTLSVSIPPAAGDKLDAVVRFALEDQLAGDIDLQHVVIASRSRQAADGTNRAADRSSVRVHVIDKRWLIDALDRLAGRGIEITRAVAESDLAPRGFDALGTWIYHGDGGFLIERNGNVATLDQSGDALPSALLLAIDRYADVAADGARVAVHGPAALGSRIETWQRATGVRFELRPEWSWTHGNDENDRGGSAISAAPDLLTPALRRKPGASIARARSAWRTPLAWLAAAVLLQVGATAVAWGSLQWRVASLERETAKAIRVAAPDLSGDPQAAWGKYYADFRHRSGKTAPGDALPMLADAADGLREIGSGAVRAIAFEAGQLTLDFERPAAAAIANAVPRWTAAGLTALQADTPSGIRVRLTRE